MTWSPGQARDVLVDGADPIITISGAPTYPTSGELDLTVVSTTTADSRLSLPQALVAYWRPKHDALPREAIYPPGKSVDDVESDDAEMMVDAQDDAVVAALRADCDRVDLLPAVASVTIGSPAQNRLRPGDLVVSVGGTTTPTVESVQAAVRRAEAGVPLDFVVLRDKVRTDVSVEPKAQAAGGGRPDRHHDRHRLLLRPADLLRPRAADRRAQRRPRLRAGHLRQADAGRAPRRPARGRDRHDRPRGHGRRDRRHPGEDRRGRAGRGDHVPRAGARTAPTSRASAPRCGSSASTTLSDAIDVGPRARHGRAAASSSRPARLPRDHTTPPRRPRPWGSRTAARRCSPLSSSSSTTWPRRAGTRRRGCSRSSRPTRSRPPSLTWPRRSSCARRPTAARPAR